MIDKPKFELGQVVATPGGIDALKSAGQTARELLARHLGGRGLGRSRPAGQVVERRGVDRREPHLLGLYAEVGRPHLGHHRGGRG